MEKRTKIIIAIVAIVIIAVVIYFVAYKKNRTAKIINMPVEPKADVIVTPPPTPKA